MTCAPACLRGASVARRATSTNPFINARARPEATVSCTRHAWVHRRLLRKDHCEVCAFRLSVSCLVGQSSMMKRCAQVLRRSRPTGHGAKRPTRAPDPGRRPLTVGHGAAQPPRLRLHSPPTATTTTTITRRSIRVLTGAHRPVRLFDCQSSWSEAARQPLYCLSFPAQVPSATRNRQGNVRRRLPRPRPADPAAIAHSRRLANR